MDAPSPLFDGIARWLFDRGLDDSSLSAVVEGFGRRLVQGGVPVYRISLGGMLLHPVFGALDVAWDARSGTARVEAFPRSRIRSAGFQDTPFFVAAAEGLSFQRFHLETGEQPREYPLFASLRAQGVTDYLVFYRDYGRRDRALWDGLPRGLDGALASFSTRRAGGFSEREIAYIRALNAPLSLVVKSKTGVRLARTLLDTYLGHQTGQQVLSGLVDRGSGRTIDCVLWYCDLRGSTELSARLSMPEYLATLDAYFEATAGAVLEHGGEVLKFIGDAVMAIFPIEGEARPAAEMRRAALSAARAAFARTETTNREREAAGLPTIAFGVALHAGEVLYGNVGTDRRLDFTVVGPAVNMAQRLEALSKEIDARLIASAAFAHACPERLVRLGALSAPGFGGKIEMFALPDDAGSGTSRCVRATPVCRSA